MAGYSCLRTHHLVPLDKWDKSAREMQFVLTRFVFFSDSCGPEESSLFVVNLASCCCWSVLMQQMADMDVTVHKNGSPFISGVRNWNELL